MVVFAVLAFFRLRMLALARNMRLRFEERLAERTRIAQDMHDEIGSKLTRISFLSEVARHGANAPGDNGATGGA